MLKTGLSDLVARKVAAGKFDSVAANNQEKLRLSITSVAIEPIKESLIWCQKQND